MSKLIRIVRGVYGYKNGVTTIPKTPKDKPFSVEDSIAQKLIAQGVAEIATEKVSEAEPIVKYSVNLAKREEKVVNKKAKAEEPEEEVSEESEAEGEYSENNTKDELLAILEGTGYEVTSATKRLTKPEIIALIDEQNEAPEGEQPSFDEDGVVE